MRESPLMASSGSGDRSLIRFCLKDINTPGRARIHQVSSKGHKGLVHLLFVHATKYGVINTGGRYHPSLSWHNA